VIHFIYVTTRSWHNHSCRDLSVFKESKKVAEDLACVFFVNITGDGILLADLNHGLCIFISMIMYIVIQLKGCFFPDTLYTRKVGYNSFSLCTDTGFIAVRENMENLESPKNPKKNPMNSKQTS